MQSRSVRYAGTHALVAEQNIPTRQASYLATLPHLVHNPAMAWRRVLRALLVLAGCQAAATVHQTELQELAVDTRFHERKLLDAIFG